MTPETWTTIGIIIAALVIVGAIAWFIMKRSRGAGSDRELMVKQRGDDRAAMIREMEALREQNRLLTERVDRYDRAHTEMRDQISRLREEAAVRAERIAPLEKSPQELQEQIFELREESKVLMQRDDRHERTVQQLQAEINELRAALRADHHAVR
jgi:chromosome segregation ATPase